MSVPDPHTSEHEKKLSRTTGSDFSILNSHFSHNSSTRINLVNEIYAHCILHQCWSFHLAKFILKTCFMDYELVVSGSHLIRCELWPPLMLSKTMKLIYSFLYNLPSARKDSINYCALYFVTESYDIWLNPVV